eukprot:m.924829 g.924829  ORF g.924829 m.924829 type:complete len:95 (+) comp124543_c0_seq1:287-571(+)
MQATLKQILPETATSFLQHVPVDDHDILVVLFPIRQPCSFSTDFALACFCLNPQTAVGSVQNVARASQLVDCSLDGFKILLMQALGGHRLTFVP